MTNKQVIDKICELKSLAVKDQDYEMATKLRDIENSFNGAYGNTYIEPTLENLKIELNKVIEYFSKYQSKTHWNFRYLRDLKLKLILDEI